MSAYDGNIGSSPALAANAPSVDEEFDAAFDQAVSEAGLAPDNSGAEPAADIATAEVAGNSPAPVNTGAQQPVAGYTPPAQATPNDDVWSSADPVLRQAHENAIRDMQLRLEGAKGRTSGQERELRLLRQQLAELKAGNSGSQAQTEGQSESTGETTPKRNERLQRTREEYPEVAEPLIEELEALKEKLAQLEQPVGQLQQQQTNAIFEAQERLLAEKHPDWLEVATDERFGGWLQSQPLAIKEAFGRNSEHIADWAEAALVVGQFKSDLGLMGQHQFAAPTNSPNDRRQRQISAGRDAGRNGPAVASGIPDDFDAAFEVFAARAAKR